MYDLQNIINVNSDAKYKDLAALNGSNANQIAIARILKAYYFQIVTDYWGDVPYTQALKGNSDIAYDKQSAIYPALIAELKAAKEKKIAEFLTPEQIQSVKAYYEEMGKNKPKKAVK